MTKLRLFFVEGPFFIWAPLCLFFGYQFVLRVAPNVMMPELLASFHVTATSFGILTSLYYLGYSLMQIPIGLSLDLYGPRRVTLLCVLLCVFGSIVFALSQNWALSMLARLLIGMGSSGAFISCVKVARSLVSKRHLSLLISLTVTVGLLCAHQAGRFINHLIEWGGWQKTTLLLGLVGLLPLVSIGIFVKESKQTERVLLLNRHFFSQCTRHVLSNNILWLSLWGCLLTGPLYVLGDVWGVSYMMAVFSWTKHQATEASTIIYLGLALGGPALVALLGRWPHLGEKFKIGMMGLAMACILVLEMTLKPSYEIVLFLNFIMGAFCSYQVLVFSLVALGTPQHLGGVVVGTVNSINMLSGFLFLPLVGYILDYFWDGARLHTVPVYSSNAYQWALSIIVIGLITGSFGFFCINTKTQIHKK